MNTMQITEHERTEWRRMAADVAELGYEQVADEMYAAANCHDLSVQEYDIVAILYRQWLNFGKSIYKPDSA